MTTPMCAGMRLRPLGNLEDADALPALQADPATTPIWMCEIFSQRAIDKIQKSMPEASHA